jgi:hypothetical protein
VHKHEELAGKDLAEKHTTELRRSSWSGNNPAWQRGATCKARWRGAVEKDDVMVDDDWWGMKCLEEIEHPILATLVVPRQNASRVWLFC